MSEKPIFKIDTSVPNYTFENWRSSTLQWISKEKAKIEKDSGKKIRILHGNWSYYSPSKERPIFMEFSFDADNNILTVEIYNPYYKGNFISAWKENIDDYYNFLEINNKDLFKKLFVKEDIQTKKNSVLQSVIFFAIMLLVLLYLIFTTKFLVESPFALFLTAIMFIIIFYIIINMRWSLYKKYEAEEKKLN